MIKSVRRSNRNRAGNNFLLLMRLSFLLTVVLWFWGFYDVTDSIGDIVIEAIVAVVLSIFTFEIVALGLTLLLVPVMVVVRIFKDGSSSKD